MNGQVLYHDIFDHKGPLIFFIYGFAYIISNDTFLGGYIIESLFLFAGLSYIYLTARLYINNVYSFIVALLFSLFALEHGANGGSAEEFILMLMCIGTYYFVKYFKEPYQSVPKWVMFRHGVLAMAVFLIKLNLVVFFAFPLLVIFLQLLYRKEFKAFAISLTYTALGSLALILPIVGYFVLNSSFSDFWFSYFEFNRLYSVIVIDHHFFIGLAVKFSKLLFIFPVFTFFVMLGIFSFVFTPIFIKNTWGRVGLFLSALTLFVTILGVRYVLIYYYVPLAVFAALGWLSIAYFVNRWFDIKKTYFKYIYVVCSIVILLSGCYMKDFFGEKPSKLLSREFNTSVETAFTPTLNKENNPTLMILGLDDGISLFTKANVLPNVKYFFYPNIFYPSYPVVRDAQESYINNKEVDFIIMCDIAIYYDYFTGLESLKNNYSVVNTFKDPKNDITYYLYKVK